MPVFNGINLIEKSIESVSSQSLKDLELICINTNSNDNQDALNDLNEKYDFIKIIDDENEEIKSYNLGISKSSGEYIAFLNPGDIFIDKNTLNKLYKQANKFDADMVGANLKIINSNGEISDDPRYEREELERFYKEDLMRPKHYGLPWAYYKNIYKKDMLLKNKIEFPDLSIGEGIVFLADILTTITDIYIMPVDFYGLSADNSEYKNKLKTPQFKYDYINHFKMVFEILDYHKFKKNSIKLKELFITYLKTAMENNDFDIYYGFNEIFDDITSLKDEYMDDILNFNVYFILRLIRDCETVHEFYEYKDKLIEMDLQLKPTLLKKILLELIFIFSSKNFEYYNLHKDEFIKSLEDLDI